jgi:DNA-binding NarL/FixJ family response regulator
MVDCASASALVESGPASRPKTVSVVIVDDHPVYRQGLAKLLAEAGIEVVGEAASGLAAIEAVAVTAPDVVLMDLKMPGLSGVEATRLLTERTPPSRVVALSVLDDESHVTDAIQAGATGYVLKDRPVEELVAGIWAAIRGESFISSRVVPTLLERVREQEDTHPALPPVPLSRRELAVLKLIAEGRANHEISAALRIDPGTVRKHVSRILRKLAVENRVQAAVRAVRDRIV